MGVPVSLVFRRHYGKLLSQCAVEPFYEAVALWVKGCGAGLMGPQFFALQSSVPAGLLVL